MTIEQNQSTIALALFFIQEQNIIKKELCYTKYFIDGNAI